MSQLHCGGPVENVGFLMLDIDLYSRGHDQLDREALEPFYRELVEEFFPEPLRW